MWSVPNSLDDALSLTPRETLTNTSRSLPTTAGSILQRDGRANVQEMDEEGTLAWIERGYPYETEE